MPIIIRQNLMANKEKIYIFASFALNIYLRRTWKKLKKNQEHFLHLIGEKILLGNWTKY